MSKNTSDKGGKATPRAPKAGDAASPHPSPLDALDDTPIAPPRARDLVAALSAYRLTSTSEPKTLATLSDYPNSVKWSVDVLVARADVTVEAAVNFLLTKGLPVLWCGGVDEIGRARAHVFAHGTTDDRYWFDACPPLEISSAGTGRRRYVVRIADNLRREAGKLASILGLPPIQILILGVMAGLVGSDVVPVTYRDSLVETVRAFCKLVQRRAARARTLADATPVTNQAQVEAGWRLEKDLWTPEDGDE